MNRRDLELLSAYLDGELKAADSVKLETRLKSDPELASVLSDLRSTRTLLRKLPSRKAPRNFTLTRRMVGQNPPLPRAYPVFRLATTIATLLLFFTFGVNFVGVQFASQAPYGMGGGGGSDMEAYSMQEAPAAAPMLESAPAMTEAPAATEAPADAANSTAEQPPVALAPMGTEMPAPTQDGSRIAETPLPTMKNMAEDNAAGQPDQPQVPNETPRPQPLISSVWQIGLAIVAVAGALLMGLLRQLSARRWK
ncbi:MAG: hypothetical protein IPP66_19855 [Anaerolineales bacterium]|nr:hypothetical protein [Anaerolineales bacterium]